MPIIGILRVNASFVTRFSGSFSSGGTKPGGDFGQIPRAGVVYNVPAVPGSIRFNAGETITYTLRVELDHFKREVPLSNAYTYEFLRRVFKDEGSLVFYETYSSSSYTNTFTTTIPLTAFSDTQLATFDGR